MPTGNEYSTVMYGQNDQNYTTTDREMAAGVQPQIGGPSGPSPAGNYPNVYDRQAGSEPTSPDYYPEQMYSPIPCTGPGQSYVNSERQSVSGEYGQSDGITNPIYPGTDMVPSPTPSKQFSSKTSGDPIELLNSTHSEVLKHSNMNQAYGLNQPVAGLGITHWLRDSFAKPDDSEPGNSAPGPGQRMPGKET